MICPRCNNVVQDGTTFCIYCGMPLQNAQENAAPVYPEVKSFDSDTVVIRQNEAATAKEENPGEAKPAAAPGLFGFSPAGETVAIRPDEPAYAPPVEPAYVPPVESAFVPPVDPSYVPPMDPSFVPPVDPSFVPPVEPSFVPPIEPIFAPSPEPEYIPPIQPETYENPQKKTNLVLPIILGILLLGAIAFGIIMMLQKNDVQSELDRTESKLEDTQDELNAAQGQMSEDSEYYSRLEEYEYAFNEIADFARYSKCGFASDAFHVNQGIVILDSDDSRKTVTLTAAFNEAVRVSMDIYGYGADASFAESTWSGDTTTIYIDRDGDLEDGEIGITTVTFTNDLNSQSFDLLIITMG